MQITFLQDESRFSVKFDVGGEKQYFQQLNDILKKVQSLLYCHQVKFGGVGCLPRENFEILGILVHFEQPRKYHIFFSLGRKRAYDNLMVNFANHWSLWTTLISYLLTLIKKYFFDCFLFHIRKERRINYCTSCRLTLSLSRLSSLLPLAFKTSRLTSVAAKVTSIFL